MHDTETKAALAKGACAWCGVGLSKYLASIGVTSWSDFAAFVASIYTLILIADWVWKKWQRRKKD